MRTSSSGLMSATRRHTGLPRPWQESHTALTTAPVARWMAPLSGPIQRSWLSDVTWRRAAHVGGDPVQLQPDDVAGQGLDGGAADVVARPMVKVRPWPSSPWASVPRMT